MRYRVGKDAIFGSNALQLFPLPAPNDLINCADYIRGDEIWIRDLADQKQK